MDLPIWFGSKYPTLEELEDLAWGLGARVLRGDIRRAFCFIPPGGSDMVPTIGLSIHSHGLEEMWNLAHEVGHFVLHAGYTSPWTHDRQEHQAALWAACALIPEARILSYRNACQDAMIAALSANYEDIPMEDCQLRRLSAEIAQYRLRALREVA